MKSFVVIGAGRFGENLAKTLSEFGNEVLVLDSREEHIRKITDTVTHAVVGDPKDEEVLRAIGLRNFDCAIIALSDDTQGSTLVTMMVKELGVPYVVAKASSEVHRRVLEKVGADNVVFPEKDMGFRLAKRLARVNILDYIEMSNDYAIAEITAPEKWIGKSLLSLRLRTKWGINVIAVKTADHRVEINIDPEYSFRKGDVVVISGSANNMEKLTM